MARILTPEQFRQCPKGTVFSFGRKWDFRGMMILDEIIAPNNDGQWGFWATDPMWADAEDSNAADALLEKSLASGSRFGCETSSTKYMNYRTHEDGRDFEVFIVLDRADWDQINRMVAFAEEARTIYPDCPVKPLEIVGLPNDLRD